MSIDWSQAPEGATEIVQDASAKTLKWAKKSHVWSFVGEKWKFRHEIWETIAKREPEQRKTVEDAVEVYGGIYPIGARNCLAFNPKSEVFGDYKDTNGHNEKWYHVCTREEFEDYVSATNKAKSEPEWTHVSSGGNLCRFLMKTMHGDLYENKLGIKFISGFEGCNLVKPIKPKITKSEKEKCAAMAGYFNINPAEFDEYMDKHEVVE